MEVFTGVLEALPSTFDFCFLNRFQEGLSARITECQHA
jgi:hypothetical protein